MVGGVSGETNCDLTCDAMKYLNRKGRLAVIALLGIAITVFSIEYLSYIYNRSSWKEINMASDVALKVLFVADPQIQGETQENFLYGWVSRWDADRYKYFPSCRP